MAVDIQLLQEDGTGEFVMSLENGDFKTIDSFDTSITVALFGDERADSSEVPAVERRRGWWGNNFGDDPEFQLGSKLWLLNQSRRTQETLNKAVTIAQNALQWLVVEEHAKNIDVTGAFTDNGIRLTIIIVRSSAVTETKFFDLWENSGAV